jgi:hypothetical protein
MILAVQPPAYFPPLAQCAKALAADVLIQADSFQFRKQEPPHRTAIRTLIGAGWLSVPVLSKSQPGARIMDLSIDARQPWAEAHWRALEYNYHNSAYFYYYADAVERAIRGAGASLAELLEQTGQFTARSLNLAAKIIAGSALPMVKERTDRLLTWANACGCDRYLLWPYEVALLDAERLRTAGVLLLILAFDPVPYHQQFAGFEPDLSILDLLFNEGPAAADYIKKNSQVQILA